VRLRLYWDACHTLAVATIKMEVINYNKNTGVFSHLEDANDPPQIEKFLSQLKTSRHQPVFSSSTKGCISVAYRDW
jgi:hypothetical protein